MTQGNNEENSLNLVGDGDELCLLDDLEQSFDIAFTQDDLKQVATVGDLYDVILRLLPGTAVGPRSLCRSASAFRRLRRSMRRMTTNDIRPSTPLRELIGRNGHRKFIEQLERESGLSLQALESPDLVLWISLSTSAACMIWAYDLPARIGVELLVGIALAAAASVAAAIVFLFPATVLFGRWSSSNLLGDIVTVGDLATRAAHLNFARLGNNATQSHPRDVWRTLEWHARQNSDHNVELNRQTRLLMD